MSSPPAEQEPLLPPSTHLSQASRSRLHARRYLPSPLSAKARGKQPAGDSSDDEDEEGEEDGPGPLVERQASVSGRLVTVIFSNEASAGGNVDVWVEDGESVGSVKDTIRQLRPSVAGQQLRLIHAGRLLTDGILLVPWLKSLEERVRRQAGGMGSGVGDVFRELAPDLTESPSRPTSPTATSAPPQKVYLHCNVGGPLGASTPSEEPEEPAPPRRRGFDALLDAGLSADEVAAMRRQFYESRGEEVPEGFGTGELNDEHARALEEQWIEGDLTPETATTSQEGMYTSILHGLLAGFLFPLTPWFFFREQPLPNFFDAEAEGEERLRRLEREAEAEEARRVSAHAAYVRGRSGSVLSGTEGDVPEAESAISSETRAREEEERQPDTPDSLDPVSARVSSSPGIGSELVSSVVFSKRMRIGIILGTLINVVFGALRFLNG